MAIVRTPMIDDDGSQTTGTIVNAAWKTELYNQIDATAGSVWNRLPFNAANYTAAAGTWTVDPVSSVIDYTVVGNSLLVNFIVHGSQALSAQTPYLYISLAPLGGASVYHGGTFTYYWLSGSQVGSGLIEMRPGENRIALARDPGQLPWGAGSAAGYIQWQFFYRYQ